MTSRNWLSRCPRCTAGASRCSAGYGLDGAGVPGMLASYTAMRLTTWTSPSAIALRDGLAMTLGKLAPAAALRGLAPIYDWHPPASTG